MAGSDVNPLRALRIVRTWNPMDKIIKRDPNTGRVKHATVYGLTYAEIDGPDDRWVMAIVDGYKTPQEFGKVVAFLGTFDDVDLSEVQIVTIMIALHHLADHGTDAEAVEREAARPIGYGLVQR